MEFPVAGRRRSENSRPALDPDKEEGKKHGLSFSSMTSKTERWGAEPMAEISSSDRGRRKGKKGREERSAGNSGRRRGKRKEAPEHYFLPSQGGGRGKERQHIKRKLKRIGRDAILLF